MKITTIQKRDDSYFVRIPKTTLEALNLKEGQVVTVVPTRDGRSISVTPSMPSANSLEDMLALVTPESIHPEIDWGPPVGKEIW